MSLLTRALALSPRAAAAAPGMRLSRPVSFVAGSSGAANTYASSSAPRISPTDNASAVVYRCVQTTTNPLAALQAGVRRVDGDLNTQDPIALLWNRNPNPLLSAYVLKSIMWQQLELSGEAFIYQDRGESGTGPVTELWPIFHPVTVIASKDIAGAIEGYVVNVAGKKVPLLPGEVLWLRYPHPTNPWGCQAPWRAASWAAELDQHARGWQLGEYLNGARPEGIFYLGDVDEDVHNATVEAWRSRHVGARNALKHLFVSGPTPANYARVGLTPAEMSYIESRKVNAEEVMLAFGVHPDLLRGGATFENQRAAKVNLWSESLVPKLEVVTSEVDRQQLPDPRQSFEFDLSKVEALQENEDSKVQRIQKAMYVDTMLVDEARAEMGLDPLPEGRGQFTLTVFRQRELDRLPGHLSPSEAAARTVQLALTTGKDAPERPPVRRPLTGRRSREGTRLALISEDEVLAQYDRWEKRGVKVLQQLAEKQQRVVLRKLKESERKRDVRATTPDLFDRAYWTDFTRDFLDGWVQGIYSAGAMSTAAALGIEFDVFDAAVTEAMSTRLATLANQITDTTYQAIEAELLKEGVELGEGIPKLAERLAQVFTDLAGYRAERIARTETVGGYNEASRTAAVASGVVAHRQWMATKDSRTRETHRALDGHNTASMSDPYPNGCMFPGDPNGPAAETVNCRCVEIYAVPEEK